MINIILIVCVPDYVFTFCAVKFKQMCRWLSDSVEKYNN